MRRHIADRTRLTLYAYQNRGLRFDSELIEDRDALERYLDRLAGIAGVRLVIDAPGVGSGTVDEARRSLVRVVHVVA